MKELNILLYTHEEDLDGKSCHIITEQFCRFENLTTVWCTTKNMNKMVESTIKNNVLMLEPDIVIISDLSLSKSTISYANSIIKELSPKTKFYFVDHHKTSAFMSNAKCARLNLDAKNPKSATYLIYHLLKDEIYPHKRIPKWSMKRMEHYVNLVSDYDTYYWKKNMNWDAKRLAILFDILHYKGTSGIVKDCDEFHQYVDCHLTSFVSRNIFTKYANYIINIREKEQNSYIARKMKESVKLDFGKLMDLSFGVDIFQYKCGVVFSERSEFFSELGNQICDTYKDKIDFCIIVNPVSKYASMRSLETGADVSEIAHHFGGGGHKCASGFTLLTDNSKLLFKQLMSLEDLDLTVEHLYEKIEID